MTADPARPSGLGHRLLREISTMEEADAIVGDIHEDLERRAAAGRAPRWPAVWLTWQIWAAVAGALLRAGMRGARAWRYIFRDAWRSLRATPGVNLFAFVVLAIAIGAGTVTFSVVDTVVLRSLPFEDDHELVVIGPTQSPLSSPIVSAAEYLAWREAPAMEGLAAITGGPAVTTPAAEGVRARRTTAGLFEVLGVEPILGDAFTGANEVEGSDDVAVIGYGFWQRAFGGEPDALGRLITLRISDDETRQARVVGVMPPGFTYPLAEQPVAEVWVPFVIPETERTVERGVSSYLTVIGRLADGADLAAAQAQLRTASASLMAVHGPETQAERAPVVFTLHEHLVGSVEGWMLLVLSAVALVMLVACVNIANLMLSRAEARGRELALRTALGASRRQVGATLLVESVMLSLAAAALGVLAAWWGLGAARSALPADIARVADIAIDLRVLTVAVVGAVGAGMFFGVVPAWLAGKGPLASALRSGGPTVAGSRQRWRTTFVVSQVAFVGVLLVVATLFVSSFVRLTSANLGFDRSNLLHFQMSTDDSSRIVDALRDVPGVESVATVTGSSPPLVMAAFGGGSGTTRLRRAGGVDPQVSGVMYRVTPEFFATAGLELLAGRRFEPGDEFGAVVILDELAVERLFPDGANPVGSAVSRGDEFADTTVVGVVRTMRMRGPEGEDRPQILYADSSAGGFTNFLVRTTRSPADVRPDVSAALARVLPAGASVPTVRPIEDAFRILTAARRFNAQLMSAFGLLALFIGAAGVYAVMASMVAQQRRELGVRVALGATPRQVVQSVLARAGRYLVAGLAVGLLAGRVASESFASLLYDVQPDDGSTYVVVAALLLTVGLLAALVPARRAARVDPLVTLRSE